jgi:hypothetical protein
VNPPTAEFTVCADDRCLCPAEVIEDYTIPDSEGTPVRHRIVLCVGMGRHRYHVIGDGDYYTPETTAP